MVTDPVHDEAEKERQNLVISSGYVYVPIYSHGGKELFQSVFEYHYFEKLLSEMDGALKPVAYTLLPDQVHIVFKLDGDLVNSVNSLTLAYTQWHHRIRHIHGSLFDEIKHWVIIQPEKYLAHYARFVHWIPVLLGKISSPDIYPWSSHKLYLLGNPPHWLEHGLVISQISNQRAHHIDRYIAFMAKSRPTFEEYYQGNQSQLNVYGSSRFLAMLTEQPSQQKSLLQTKNDERISTEKLQQALNEIQRLVAGEYNVSLDVAQGKQRHRLYGDMLALTAWLIEQSGLDMAESARQIGLDSHLLQARSRAAMMHHKHSYLTALLDKYHKNTHLVV